MVSNIYVVKTLYMACYTFICTILFGLSESSKLIVFKDQFGKIFEAKVAENDFFALFRDSITSRIKFLNKVILDYSDRSNMIVQMNNVCVFYSVIVILIFDV